MKTTMNILQRWCWLMLLMLSLSANAQEAQPETSQPVVKFGYVSYDSLLRAMPDYALVQTNMEALRAQYAAEQKRVEDDFNKKYEDFLDGQRDFPQTILQKRQSELQELLDKNIAFKKESQRLIAEAETEAMAPLRQKLSEALAQVGQERGLAFILDTDRQTTLFINPAQGEDVTEAVLGLLK